MPCASAFESTLYGDYTTVGSQLVCAQRHCEDQEDGDWGSRSTKDKVLVSKRDKVTGEIALQHVPEFV